MARTKYSILALDGGGIRGVIPAAVLDAIEQRLGRPAYELFDLVAGTSTGGIIALGLTVPGRGGAAFTAADLVRLYRDHGDQIFPRPTFAGRLRTGWGWADVRYRAEPLEELLRDRFGTVKLSQALREVVIPSYDLSKPAPFFFKRKYARDESHHWDVEMWRAARASSAAPTYLDPAQLPAFEDEGDHALVDGGVFANNPAACAYVDALDLWPGDAQMHVVSIGTGQPPEVPGRGNIPIPYQRARRWGLMRWARPIVDVVFDGAADAVEYQMLRLCRHGDEATPRYFRLQSSLPTASHRLDDASPRNLDALLRDAAALLREKAAELDSVCAALAAVAADRDAMAVP